MFLSERIGTNSYRRERQQNNMQNNKKSKINNTEVNGMNQN